jgi:aspartate aminotransferase
MHLSSRLQKFNEPETLKMAKLGRELRAKGLDITDLSLGEPDFDTPKHIKKAAINAIKENWSHYPPVAGYLDLREAICYKFKRDNDLEYKPENILVSAGAKQSIANLVMAVIEEGDEVIIPTPYWVTYSEIVKLADGKVKLVNTTLENGYKITAQQLEEAITPATKLFMFSSPCNPTGAVYTHDELSALAEVFGKHPHILIMADEIYEYINFAGRHESIAQFEALKDRVVIINGLSKGFAMTGYRLGYLAANAEVTKACEKVQGQFTSGTNSVTQRAAIEALKHDLRPTEKMVKEFKKRRKKVLKLLKEMKGMESFEPDGAFYVFPKVTAFFGKSYGDYKIENADDLSMYLLQEGHVTTVTGKAFGNPECIRLSFANSMDNIEKGLKKIKEALEKLK